MDTKLQKWGNSQGIRIPKYVLNRVDWKIDDYLDIVVNADEIILRKSNEYPVIDLEKKFLEYEGKFPTDEIDWGEPEGDEVW